MAKIGRYHNEDLEWLNHERRKPKKTTTYWYDKRGEDAVSLLAQYLECEDWWESAELLKKYEKALADFHQSELDWEICFRCGIQVVDKAKGIHLNRGQSFGSWGGYSMAQLCGNCSREVWPIHGSLPSLDETRYIGFYESSR